MSGEWIDRRPVQRGESSGVGFRDMWEGTDLGSLIGRLGHEARLVNRRQATVSQDGDRWRGDERIGRYDDWTEEPRVRMTGSPYSTLWWVEGVGRHASQDQSASPADNLLKANR